MPQYDYRGRDREGRLRIGQRIAASPDALNADLIKEGISPTHISETVNKTSLLNTIRNFFESNQLQNTELAIFSRQMQLLHQAGVPITTAIRQLAANTRNRRLKEALDGIVQELEKGQNLSSAMRNYPSVFTPLMSNVVQIGESSGHLSEAFGHLYQYLEFEGNSKKQIKAAFRYPMFVVIAIFLAIIVLNIFVIPAFAKFYTDLKVPLPWETRLIVNTSNIVVHYGIFILMGFGLIGYLIYSYIQTPAGKYKWHKLLLNLPVIGKLLRRINLIRLTQSLSIILASGISLTQGLTLVKNMINNAYIADQLSQMQTAIERGQSFTQAIGMVDIFAPLEIQILAVGESNGELTPALNYIGEFHSQEIAFDLKKMSDLVGPLMILAVSAIVLVIALGVYLPIWNMINLVHS